MGKNKNSMIFSPTQGYLRPSFSSIAELLGFHYAYTARPCLIFRDRDDRQWIWSVLGCKDKLADIGEESPLRYPKPVVFVHGKRLAVFSHGVRDTYIDVCMP
jgi:hypothetical protein